ncbi:MAG: hypothetical protein NTZ83_00190 [Candidatus Pacearchaeota archaeon]|nr:hypothetical protein [Candidatus Pacearchaeota archaeon]
MKKEDTRGLSTVVATLLIILLVIVAIAIIWGVIRTVIIKGSESISLGKFTVDLEIVSIRQTPQDVNIKVRRNAGEGELEGIIFSIFDGKETHIYEKRNVSLEQLETKTFVVDYQGKIVSVSIYPLFLGENGKTLTGDVADTYFIYTTGGGSGGGYIDPNCTTDCSGKECGDNGCGGSCGTGCSGSTPYCVQGDCEADTGGIEPDCTCALINCIGRTCDDGLGGSCPGQLQPDCTGLMCGPSENGCGGPDACDVCETGYHCSEGACILDCNHTANCLVKECGDDECGGECGYCEILHNSSYNCNAVGVCEMCTPDCGTRECGPVPNTCGESCGNCTELYGVPEDSCTSEGICGRSLDQGIIATVWPWPWGRFYFDSPELNTSEEVDYFGYYVKFPGSDEEIQDLCLRIWDFVLPETPPYNMSYIRLAATSTGIKAGDNYEVWETYEGCCKGELCERL